MSPGTHQFLLIDLMPMLAGVLASTACGLLGNFLVLRRLSLMGDAISHAVLPGIVIAFLIVHQRTTIPVLIGATTAGVICALLVEVVRRLAKLESGASMGVVFTIMFAIGVVLIERAAARHVDLDAGCLLYGQLEMVFWLDAPNQWRDLLTLTPYLGVDGSEGVPRQIITLLVTNMLAGLFVVVFFKELRLVTFDPQLAASLGFRPGLMNVVLMIFVALAVVASFEAVGSILVIAMLICPAATARLLTDRLRSQILISVIIAALTGVLGYVFAARVLAWLGIDGALSASGMMAVVGGLLLGVAIVCSPSHGLVAAFARRTALALRMAQEDVLAALYRTEELAPDRGLTRAALRQIAGGGAIGALAVRGVDRHRLLRWRDDAAHLTEDGRADATQIVRSHRLWEAFLVREIGLRADHVHETATRLEHLTRRGRRVEPDVDAATDPHERPIPPPG